MKKISAPIFIAIMSFVAGECLAQSDICLQLVPRDFGVWAFQKHNEICKVIYDNIKTGKLGSYNAKNLKETQKETLGKLAVNQVVVFVQDDPNDPVVGHDSSYFTDKTENYHLFKISNEYVLLKPAKNSNNLLKIKKAEMFALLNAEQKEYFNNYTSNFALCIDSIPVISKRLFMHYNSKLFEYSKRPDVKLYLTDSLNKVLTMEEKAFLSMDQYMAFISTDPDDPSIGHDTIVLADYNMKDSTKDHAIFFMVSLMNDFCIAKHSISCGLQRSSVGFAPFMIPYGFLPFSENIGYTASEMNILSSALRTKMSDDLNSYEFNEENYDDYFGGVE